MFSLDYLATSNQSQPQLVRSTPLKPNVICIQLSNGALWMELSRL